MSETDAKQDCGHKKCAGGPAVLNGQVVSALPCPQCRIAQLEAEVAQLVTRLAEKQTTLADRSERIAVLGVEVERLKEELAHNDSIEGCHAADAKVHSLEKALGEIVDGAPHDEWWSVKIARAALAETTGETE